MLLCQTMDGSAGQGHGVVAGPGQEGGSLLQLHIAVRKGAQSALGGERAAEDLAAQRRGQLVRDSISPLLQCGIQLRDSSGQLGKCVFIGFVQQIAVLCRLDPALNGVSAQDHPHPPSEKLPPGPWSG